MAKFEKVPHYVPAGTTPQDIADAREQFSRLKTNFAWYRQAQFRQAAMLARMQLGGYITAMEFVEFGDVIPEGYIPRQELEAGRVAEHRKMLDNNRRAWEKAEAERRAAEAQKQRDLMSITDPREAQASLPPAEYMAWCQLPHAQRAIAQMMG
jgi:hypothetical protein